VAGPLALAGGADVFVFGARDGRDTITDFRAADGNRVDLSATLLGWEALDSDGSGFLDGGDACVAVAGGDTRIDLGLPTGGTAGQHVVTVVETVELGEGDFLLV
jgi:hypothetical protein